MFDAHECVILLFSSLRIPSLKKILLGLSFEIFNGIQGIVAHTIYYGGPAPGVGRAVEMMRRRPTPFVMANTQDIPSWK